MPQATQQCLEDEHHFECILNECIEDVGKGLEEVSESLSQVRTTFFRILFCLIVNEV